MSHAAKMIRKPDGATNGVGSGELVRRRGLVAEIPLPTIPDALRFRSEQMGWNDSMMASKLGMGRSHYSEVLSGKRPLPLSAIRKAYALGVPASVLLQPNIKMTDADLPDVRTPDGRT